MDANYSGRFFMRTKSGRKVHAGRAGSVQSDCGRRVAGKARPVLSSPLCEQCFSEAHQAWLRAVSPMFYWAVR